MKFEVGQRVLTVTKDRWYNEKVGLIACFDESEGKYRVELEVMGIGLLFKEDELRKY